MMKLISLPEGKKKKKKGTYIVGFITAALKAERRDYAPQGSSGKFWRCFCLSCPGRCYQHPVGRERPEMPTTPQCGPLPRIIWP